MNREEYREAFDAIPFSEDFQARTAALLRARARELEQEESKMTFRKTRRIIVCAAAAVAVLALSVSAAVLWLSPQEVADRVEEPLLAEAFQGDGAVVLDESVTAGDYQITLAGMVSGEDLSVPAEYNGEIINDRTYAVFRVARADGAPLTDYPNLSYSPLVDGYHVRCVNAWTLGTTTQQFIEDGVIYCLFDCRNLEMFADHPVRFAIYEGGVPNTDLFSMAEDGTISLRENVVGALFTLPLDASKADPEAAQAFVESTGLVWEPMTDAELAALDQETPEVSVSQDGATVAIGEPASGAEREGLTPFTAETFRTYLAEELERMARQVEEGTLSQASYERTAAELEETLAGLEDGTLTAYLDGGGVLVTVSGDGAAVQSENGALAVDITGAD